MNIFYCVIISKHYVKSKTLVFGKISTWIFFQTRDVGNFKKRKIIRIRTKTFVITNSMKGNILWGDIYKWTYFLIACFLLVVFVLIFCFIVKNQHPRSYSWRYGRTGTLWEFLSIALLSCGARIMPAIDSPSQGFTCLNVVLHSR